MNQNQKIKIAELRKEGLGYKKIASELGISVNTIKSFCRSKKLTTKDLTGIDVCKRCGKRIIQTEHRRKKLFCSLECKTKWFNRNRRKPNGEKVICINCGKVFKAYSHEKRKYCCHSCYIESRFKGGYGNEE